MDEELNQLIEMALEGIEFALNPKNNISFLPGTEVLPEIKQGLLRYKIEKGIANLQETLDLYKESNMMNSGKTEYDAVWYKPVQVRGKEELFGSIFDDMEDAAWKIAKASLQ